MDRLPIKKLKFGKTDAFNELVEFGDEWFTKSFFAFEKYRISQFISGERYYICGEKGTGKTALLRFLQCDLSRNPENLIIPIRFKTDLDSEDKKGINRAANIKDVVAENIEDFSNAPDAVNVWEIFIINKLFSSYETDGEYHLFCESKELDSIKKLLKLVYPEPKNKIVPVLKHGNLNLSANVLNLIDAELQLEIGVKQSSPISFSSVAKAILKYFSKLSFDKNTAYILFDELELSMRSTKEHNRDISLIRDLILAINHLNEICKLNGYKVHIVTSLRTEVISSVQNAGYEINKCIEDYGIILTWYQRGGTYENNKLIQLIENKIKACEEMNGIFDHEDVWKKYFPEYINNTETKKYILNYSWMHPRDIVRLLNLVCDQAQDETFFTQEMFDRALKQYSKSSWNEICEEMCLKYSPSEIETIKQSLIKLEMPFTFQSFSEHLEQLSQIDEEYAALKKKHNIKEILVDLFKYGIIGNSGQKMVFKFMEEDDLSITEPMIIHTPLRNFFSVKFSGRGRYNLYDSNTLVTLP